ncbi:MAG TPA: CHAT domain-containing tetratricopeptide repeat protein [Candidatus Acidoferrales bacterium]|nr:CHAT domain-containing tetratricopeptide repeat protein [Candidatus Acidoferrales bacterium]
MTPAPKKNSLTEGVLREMANLKDDASRAKYFARRPRLRNKNVVQQLNDVVRTKLREDAQQALLLAEAAVAIARRLRNGEALGRSLRSKANALYMIGDNQKALEFHAQAIEIFQKTGDAQQEARTLIPSIQPLILLGQYDRAFDAAQAAKKIFERLDDKQRLGHLEINVGNIYHRQDRFEEGLACYERAYEMLLPFRDAEGLAVTLYNMAVCLITLNDFPRALTTYQRAREMCVQHGMTLLVTQSDYNIAYLYYLRGEYSRAIEMLRATREKCEENGDAHVLALCYLDLSEIYLELNLSTEARDVAHEGYLRFQKLGMGYEEAKCQANEAMSLSQLGKALGALELFDEARVKFVREKNLVWPWLIDLYQAVVLYNEGRLFEARRLCARAAKFFDTSLLPGKGVLCQLLLSRLSVRTGDLAAASKECVRALERLASLEAPVLGYQAEFLMGQIQQASGNPNAAYASHQKAREALETLRSSLRGEELKIAFMKNRLEVYECLVDICMNDASKQNSAEESFGYMEMAKSRSLAELLVHHAQALPAADAGQSGLVRRIREMREELNWYYRRLEQEQLRGEDPSPERIEKLQKQALAHENELLRALRELPAPQQIGGLGQDAALASLESIRAALPVDAVLVEYFIVKDEFIAAVLTREKLKIIPLTPVSRVVNLLRMLHFQISKFSLGGGYTQEFAKPLFDAAQAHLKELYEEVLAPLRGHLRGRHLVIVPHGVLHYLPFHALFDGDRYMIDSFTVSYAPSAGIFSLCQVKASGASGAPLVLGVPDAQAPLILEEVESIAKILPGAKLLVGAEANIEALRTSGLHSRILHIATHGTFRQDNPMFSGIRLGDAYLNLYDLYQLKLEAELVTLSGCATGLNVVTAGDELLGLIRGLLYAGAQSLLLTLWNVHDRSTADFMISFYRRFQADANKAVALQGAMQDLRQRYPHPYYWAPFVFIGKIYAA